MLFGLVTSPTHDGLRAHTEALDGGHHRCRRPDDVSEQAWHYPRDRSCRNWRPQSGTRGPPAPGCGQTVLCAAVFLAKRESALAGNRLAHRKPGRSRTFRSRTSRHPYRTTKHCQTSMNKSYPSIVSHVKRLALSDRETADNPVRLVYREALWRSERMAT